MPDPMTGFYEGPPRAERVEVITSVQRRRRWSTEEKVRIVEETYLPGNPVSPSHKRSEWPLYPQPFWPAVGQRKRVKLDGRSRRAIDVTRPTATVTRL
jgi:hypothetical protein